MARWMTVVLLALLVAGSAAAIMGRHPKSGIRGAQGGSGPPAVSGSSSSSLWDSMKWDQGKWG